MALPPLISLEEHFISTHTLPHLTNIYSEQLKYIPNLSAKLQDIGSIRLADMDQNHISLQIISHAPGPGTLSVTLCQQANDQLSTAVRANPKRFAGLAVLPMNAPKDAAAELRRCVKELGFLGALVDNHANGTYYDGKEFLPIFEAAVELDVPIYLHPTFPSDGQKAIYQGNFSRGVELSIGCSGFGWHQDCGLHVLKLYAAGLFDKLPHLKIIIGHFGEMLPFMLERVEKLSVRWGERERGWRQVWDENIWITTSGVWSLAPMACILRNTKIDRVLFSVDYPFEKNENGVKWMEELRESGMVTEEQLEMIAYRNAEKLLGLKAIG